ncbi:lipoprotein-releasing ABC transporter permease subunit [Teredinibacter purpureus]|uniref:lipoprotein-releasing ABC transporter permease subunit n=1 Tax=Teredinibacter purpureus TaxID=2731756 RepID=UPI0005F7C18A|nr:lipoprotein-releasing ABC transporter permease subunit [Teredinibacter purpureus]
MINSPFRSSLPLYIGLRYANAKRRNGFIAFVSLFALVGMALGVFALIVVLSVMNGFDRELKERILRVVPHGFLTTEKPLENWPVLYDRVSTTEGLNAAAPFIEGKALISFGRTVKPVQIQGIDPEFEKDISAIEQHMLIGELAYLQPGEYGIVMGNLVARHLGLTIGDKISVTLPEVSVTPAGIFPRSKRFTLVGVFEVGAQVDQYLTLIHIRDAQKLLRRGETVDGLHLKFDDIYRAPAALSALGRSLGDGVKVKDWSQTQGSLFQAVKMEKTVVGLMLSIIIAVAAFNIITSLVMMVAEKRSDIAVLRTLGMTRYDIVQIFMVQGITLGLIGIVVGAIAGVLTAIWLPEIMAFIEAHTGLMVFDPSVYFVAYLPSQWRLDDTLMVCGLSTLIAILATIYPAYRASTIEPAEALRYDI